MNKSTKVQHSSVQCSPSSQPSAYPKEVLYMVRTVEGKKRPKFTESERDSCNPSCNRGKQTAWEVLDRLQQR